MKTVIYIHGKGGSPDEASSYAHLFKGAKVIGMEYSSQTPQQAVKEFPAVFDELIAGSSEVILIANSIGAYYAMLSLAQRPVQRAFFISPIVDMEQLILDMMEQAGVTEDMLCQQGEIVTDTGETLSAQYLRFVREHPLCWHIPTEILYASEDALTSLETVTAFARNTGAGLTVAQGCEHWFHTAEQMETLFFWLQKHIST